MVAKQESTNNYDQYSKLAVIRVAKNKANETVKLKKYMYLSSVVSYEQGDSADIDVEEQTIYIVGEFECFYIVGDVDEFNKVMNDYISAMRKILNSDTNPSE